MSLLENFVKNNYKLKEEWKDNYVTDTSNLRSLLTTFPEEPFYYNNTLENNKIHREKLIANEPRLKQIINDIEKFILPYDILNQKTSVVKSPKNDGMYLADDLFARVLFSFNEETNSIEVFEIYTSLIYQITE